MQVDSVSILHCGRVGGLCLVCHSLKDNQSTPILFQFAKKRSSVNSIIALADCLCYASMRLYWQQYFTDTKLTRVLSIGFSCSCEIFKRLNLLEIAGDSARTVSLAFFSTFSIVLCQYINLMQ